MSREFQVHGAKVSISEEIRDNQGEVIRRAPIDLVDKAVEVIQKSFGILEEGRINGKPCSALKLHFVLGDISGHWIQEETQVRLLGESPLLVLQIPIWSALSDKKIATTDHRPYEIIVGVRGDWCLLQDSFGSAFETGPKILLSLAEAISNRFNGEMSMAAGMKSAAGLSGMVLHPRVSRLG